MIMKTLNQYIKEKLVINKDYRDVNMLTPKSFNELKNIIVDRYIKLGPGTKQNPIDFNDIEISNIRSFCNYDKCIGIFDSMDFKYIDISYWDVSNIESMRGMFYLCKKLKSVGDISSWDVSNVTDMSWMFYNCKSFNQDISGWDVSNVTDMSYMFAWCESFNQDISEWNVSNVTDKAGMFHCCSIKEEYKPKI